MKIVFTDWFSEYLLLPSKAIQLEVRIHISFLDSLASVQEVNMRILPAEVCRIAYPSLLDSTKNESEFICAGQSLNGISNCSVSFILSLKMRFFFLEFLKHDWTNKNNKRTQHGNVFTWEQEGCASKDVTLLWKCCRV